MSTTRVEWGLRFDETDCHEDHPGDWERAFGFGDERPQPYSDGRYYMNSHPCVLVKRTITYSAWEEADGHMVT